MALSMYEQHLIFDEPLDNQHMAPGPAQDSCFAAAEKKNISKHNFGSVFI
jgi:hypothetical protein